MFVELIATFVAGIAAAGVAMLANKFLGGRLPRWMIPVVAGVVMIGTTIASEYGWYSRTVEGLPDGVIVAEKVESSAVYRPWTFIWPLVERFAAVDVAAVQKHPRRPGMLLADVYFFGRWSAVHKLPMLADCVAKRRAALMDGITFQADGDINGIEWVDVSGEDPVLTTVCGAG